MQKEEGIISEESHVIGGSLEMDIQVDDWEARVKRLKADRQDAPVSRQQRRAAARESAKVEGMEPADRIRQLEAGMKQLQKAHGDLEKSHRVLRDNTRQLFEFVKAEVLQVDALNDVVLRLAPPMDGIVPGQDGIWTPGGKIMPVGGGNGKR